MNASMRAPLKRPGRRPPLISGERDALAVQPFDVETLGAASGRTARAVPRDRRPAPALREAPTRRPRRAGSSAAARGCLPRERDQRATRGRRCAHPALGCPASRHSMPARSRGARAGIAPSGATTSPRASRSPSASTAPCIIAAAALPTAKALTGPLRAGGRKRRAHAAPPVHCGEGWRETGPAGGFDADRR